MAKKAAGSAATTFWAFWLQAAVAMAMVASASAEDVDPDAACNSAIHSLMECIPYVTGRSPSPTPQCCWQTTLVNAQNPACLCMLLRSSADSTLQIPVNLTIALRLPTVCNITVDHVDDCPAYLGLSQDDPETRFFETINATGPVHSQSSTAVAAPNGAGRRRCSARFLAGNAAAALPMVLISWAALD